MASGSRAKRKTAGGKDDARRRHASSSADASIPVSQESSRSHPWLHRHLDGLLFAGLALLTLLLYIPVTWNDFLEFDDPEYVTANAMVQRGLTLTGVRWAFTTNHFANWLPITWLSHMLDVQFFGLNPHGHHFTNALIHALNAALVFAAVKAMTGARYRALAVAALFAVHPLRVESVAWVAERKDVLCATFFLLTLLAYVRYVRKPGLWRYLLVCLLLALGLMSKTMLVTAPFLLLLLDWWPLNRWRPGISARVAGKLVLEKAPLILLAAIASIWTTILQRDFGAVQSQYTLSKRLGNAVISVWRYLDKMVRPIDLSAMYRHPGSWPVGLVIASTVALVLVTAGLILLARRRPWALVGWLWFLGMLVPVSGIIQAGNQSMADRYTYLSGIGVTITVVWFVAEIARRSAAVRNTAMATGVLLLIVLGYLTVVQETIWRSTLDLFAYAAAIEPDNWIANHQLGRVLSAEGQDEEAIGYFRRAIQVEPMYPGTHGGLGVSLLRTGQTDEAIAELKTAVEQDPKLLAAWQWLGVAFTTRRDFDLANRTFATAAQLAPADSWTYSFWAQSLLTQDRPLQAQNMARRAIDLNPNNSQAKEVLRAAAPKAATRQNGG